MSLTFDTFTPRQTMEDGLFECHHYLDRVPPQVEYHEHEFYEIFFFLSGMSPTSLRGAPISCGRGHPPHQQRGHPQARGPGGETL